ncbi:MAG TPA: LUD domain-containing protein [Gaiellaceae bacterium]
MGKDDHDHGTASGRRLTQSSVRDCGGRGARYAGRSRSRGQRNHRHPRCQCRGGETYCPRSDPAGSEVHSGASRSLEVSGISEELEKSGRHELIGPRIWSMDRETQADEIRRLSSSPDFMLGSVHAVTETGSLLAASASGSQLGPYAAGAGKVILVVGTQKIVSDLDEGLRRVYDYVFPLEDARAEAAYGVHSGVNKILIVNREWEPGRTTVVLVDQALGF